MRKKIDNLTKKLQDSRNDWPSDASIEKEKAIKNELNALLEKEELYWKQKARTQWLNEGDKNKGFFHKQATQRRKINTIKGLEDDNEV